MTGPTGQTGPTWPVGLEEAFAAYEQALMADDVPTLDRLFAPGPGTLRGDAAGLLVGHDAIAAFRGGRGGAPARRLVETRVQVLGEAHAVVVAVTELLRGGRGLQTQVWERQPSGWVVTAAHVTVAAPALDDRVWRVVGAPLVPTTTTDGEGLLAGEGVAVKDLYAVAGHRVGAGNPAWLAAASPEPDHAWAVARLLEEGADVTGIARTDELAYSLAGTNAHHGTPPNPRAPRRIPGGSSSGSASAVSLGHASIGLGTDTGGSIRVPAAYQGLCGLRTTHDAVPRTGLLPLAPSFDTVGWLARDTETLRRVGEVLLPTHDGPEIDPSALVTVPALLALAEPDVRAAVTGFAERHGADALDWRPEDLAGWLVAFQTLQAWEAWDSHGAWLEPRLDTLGADVRSRFERGARTTAGEADDARAVLAGARAEVDALVGDHVLVLPSASSVAPPLGPGLADRLQATRDATMRLTCLAGIAGLPALGVPLVTAAGLPAGACLVAARGRDLPLLRLAEELSSQTRNIAGPRP
ncbi:Asp-tRNAAsn/Glu-tRNAGln amidotransferase A subunit [Nocardioides scoriae]|uniref:Asp-tRNAAsn/Glu-tRNAGln amidotransferase A subunit n=1 Tax=Nocardioides scoriae TaxID=642780 RepID=A0A1H1UT99_9ACTN|nr:AtzH-like domain-containing protein [Nocardioides scoriae]SDS75491.1 Asp-tRNAAsn/Glu-tRNAGln amidotransferase A subunit [Nocardioides scoriae]